MEFQSLQAMSPSNLHSSDFEAPVGMTDEEEAARWAAQHGVDISHLSEDFDDDFSDDGSR